MAGVGFLGRSFYSMRNPQFRVLWAGTFLFFLGQQMQVLARGYLAYDLTGRNSALGAVLLAYGIAQIGFTGVAGPVTDRFPKRTVLWVAQGAIAAMSAWLAITAAMGALEYWMVMASSAVSGAAFAFIGPARQAYVSSVSRPGELGNGIVLISLSASSTRVVGPSIAGVLIGIPLVGIGGVYWTTFFMMAASALTLAMLPPGAPNPNRVARSAMGDWKDAFAYVRGRPAVLQLLLVAFGLTTVGLTYTSFLPALAKADYHASAAGLGWMNSSVAVGAVTATVAVAAFAGHQRAWYAQPVLAACVGGALVVLGAAPGLALGMCALFLVGLAAGAFQSLNNSLMMMLTDASYQGRVQSLNMLAWGFWGLAAWPIGVVADHIGVRQTLALQGGVCVAIVAALQIVARAQHAADDRFAGSVRLDPRPAD